ncbi:hypothetical protein HZB90_01120, partial [archaeon]|nr:hypothetical protein [archaeon]
MKKLLLPAFFLVMLSTSALAQYGMMGSYGPGGYGMFWMGLLGLVYLALGSFVFAVV